jgi:tRNA G18 (ribose-2'-O)-methylase SpoU
MASVHIDTEGDPRIALFRNVGDADLLRDHGVFVAEGRLVVRTLLTASPLKTRAVLVTKPALETLGDLLVDGNVPVFVVPRSIMNGIVGFNIHRGCLALGERPATRPLEALLAQPDVSRLIVLENVSNADNVGGIFRCAAALGGDAVVLGPHCCDPLYRKSIRTSIGASLRVPFASATAWPGGLERLRRCGFAIVALTPAPDATALDDIAHELASHDRLALLLGAEGEGLTAEAQSAAHYRVRIPIAADVDSLNVAVAAGIALHTLRLPKQPENPRNPRTREPQNPRT